MTQCFESFLQIKRHPFEIIAFDWDGTAVENRRADAATVTAAIEGLLKTGVYLVVITGTNFENIDRQFSSYVSGPHKQNLFICANRGSEVFGFDSRSEPVLLYRRRASNQENKLLDRVGEAVKREIERESGVTIDIVYDRLNRRKIDLIPGWKEPPKSRIDELEQKTQHRLVEGGFAEGIHGAFELAEKKAGELGLADARITSDVKHIEVGLTDKSDSMRWVINELTRKHNTPLADILVLGDEFGPVAGFEGSDYRMVLPDVPGISYLSVGKEPDGVPEGVTYLGGGPACFLKLIEEQKALQEKISLTADESYHLEEHGYNALRERELESLFTLSNGYLGTRGSLEEQSPSSAASTLVTGIYDRINDDSMEELALAPDWVFTRIYVFGKQLQLEPESLLEHRRLLDMKKGVLYRWWRHRDEYGRVTLIKFARLVSMADHHTMTLRMTITPDNYSEDLLVRTGIRLCDTCVNPLQLAGADRLGDEGVYVTTRTTATDKILSMAQVTRARKAFLEPERSVRIDNTGAYEEWNWHCQMGQELTIEKYVALYTSRETEHPEREAARHVLERANSGYFDILLDHIDEWQQRWDISRVSITGARSDQKAINFAAYHLISAGAPFDNRASISARALTGTIYQGHIFWDTEIFILPFFTATHPESARAALMYRYHTLPAARAKAQKNGCRGALFAWESAESGEETTPATILFPGGEVVKVVSGEMEIHINAAIAYGAWTYWNQTGDEDFLIEAGAELLIETARFWASRVESKNSEFHILHVEGPDEYHEDVNDNMYTNMMAAWNLSRARDAVSYIRSAHPGHWPGLKRKLALEEGEPDKWKKIASSMFLDMQNGNLIEQFAGYFNLRDIDVKEYEPRTAPLDVILGREETQSSQVVKQADVLMALYLLESDLSEEAVRENYRYYESRTGHGSSLSPAIYGLMAARLGLMNQALDYYRQTADIDLANNMGNAAGGVHIAALGGLWQLVVKGFGGVRFDDEGVWVYPNLPHEWPRLQFSILWRGNRIDFDIERRGRIVAITGGGADNRLRMGIWGRRLQEVATDKTYVSEWQDGVWSEFHEEGKEAKSNEG